MAVAQGGRKKFRSLTPTYTSSRYSKVVGGTWKAPKPLSTAHLGGFHLPKTAPIHYPGVYNIITTVKLSTHSLRTCFVHIRLPLSHHINSRSTGLSFCGHFSRPPSPSLTPAFAQVNRLVVPCCTAHGPPPGGRMSGRYGHHGIVEQSTRLFGGIFIIPGTANDNHSDRQAW